MTLLATLPALSALSACGVRPIPIQTGVGAPTVTVQEVTVFFLTASRDGLVRRTRSHTGTVDTTTAINVLIGGLTEEEKKAGLVTEVPKTSQPVVAVSNVILLPGDMFPLTKMAQFQLYCTALVSQAAVTGLAGGFECP